LHGPVAADPQGDSYVQQLACKEDRPFPHYLLDRAGRNYAAVHEQTPERALRASIGRTVVRADGWRNPEWAVGQTRRFDPASITSDLHPQTDNIRDCRNVSKVPRSGRAVGHLLSRALALTDENRRSFKCRLFELDRKWST
jgi:hypothetical protein